MKITQNKPDLLVIRITRWKQPLIWAAVILFTLLIAARMVLNLGAGIGAVALFLLGTVSWMLPLGIRSAERSMLVLDAQAGEAEFRHRDWRGLHRHSFPLDEVQSTRVTRLRRDGPAADDPSRLLTLYVREGMDEGRHKLTNHEIAAEDALRASAEVSNWMQAWRERA